MTDTTSTATKLTTHFVRTDEIYREVINAPDAETRERIFREKLVEPMQGALKQFMGMFNTDLMGLVRNFNYLMPEDLTSAPPSLVALEQADAWNTAAQALTNGAAHFEPYADRLTVRHFNGWIILTNPAKADPQNKGYAGWQWHDGTLMATIDTANDYTIPRVPAAIVHELNHIVRGNVFPWDMQKTSVADYIVLEGMAESFATQLYGENVLGWFAADQTEAELATAKTVIGGALDKTGFDVIRGYIFGDEIMAKWGAAPIGMPRYGGYAIGYRVVQAYLKRTGLSVEAATFKPTDEIIRESGFFDQ